MIKEFTDLNVWKYGHELVLSIYKIEFPKSELFALEDQIKRAVVSVTSNIAEGFGRQTIREKVQFFYQAHGSLTEVKNQLIIARDLEYINEDNYLRMAELSNNTQRLLIGLIKKTKTYL